MNEYDFLKKTSEDIIDKEMKIWIDSNNEYLVSLYCSYVEGELNSTCTLEEFSIYIYFECSL